MQDPWSIIITIVVTLFASSGFWTFIMSVRTKNTAERQMILGIGYKCICDEASRHIEKGWISRQEYADLHKYLYKPYRALDGDGTCERLMKEVDNLPIKED